VGPRQEPARPLARPSASRFERLGRWAVRRRFWVVGAWVLLLAAAAPLAARTPDALRAGGFILDELESARAKALLEDEIGVPPAAVVVVFHSESVLAGSVEFEAAAAAAVQDLAGAPYVSGILSHAIAPRQVSADGRTAYDIAFLDLSPDDSPLALPGIRARIRQVPPLEVGLAGGPAFYGDVQEVSEADLRRSELISLPLATRGAQVIGLEGSKALVERARQNALANGLTAQFEVVNLFEPNLAPYGAFDKLLLDPPRDGAIELVKALPEAWPKRIVYVSCDAATLARDAGVLVNTKGFRLAAAGVVNMFPHTAHVESVALFER